MVKNNLAVISSEKKQSKEKFLYCHICMKGTLNSAECSVKRCKYSYCFQCINQKFNKDFKPTDYIKDCWICYSCGGSCKCLFCTGIDRNRKKRKSKTQSLENSVAQEKLMDLEIQEDQDNQKEQNDQKEQEINQQKIEVYKNRYERRRLPVKRNVAFKYKKRRRMRNKGSNQTKKIIENMKPEDKICKIKRVQFYKQSLQQDHDQSQSNQESDNSKRSSQNNEDEYEQKFSQQHTQKGKIAAKMQQSNERVCQQENLSQNQKNLSGISSSLQYLQEVRTKRNTRSLNKTKKIQKKNETAFVSLQQTIKRLHSKNQIRKQTKGQQKQFEDKKMEKCQSIEEVKQKPKAKRGRKPKNAVGQKLMDASKNREKQIKIDQLNQEMRNGIRLTRRTIRVEQSRKRKQIRQQQCQQVQQYQEVINRPRRITRRNYVELEQGKQRSSMEIAQEQMDQQSIGSEKQNLRNQEIISKRETNSIDINRSDNIQQEQQQEEQEGVNNEKQRLMNRNSMMKMKKHYQEELEKNIQYQVDDSSSSTPAHQNGNQNQKQSQGNNFEQPANNSFNPQNQSSDQYQHKQSIGIDENYNENHTKNQRQQQIYGKSVQHKHTEQSGRVYRKINHLKKSHHIGSENSIKAVNATAHNDTATKWSKIPDDDLLDIRNIQRIGYQALFARQNLSKQMSELIKRRNLIIENRQKINYVHNSLIRN